VLTQMGQVLGLIPTTLLFFTVWQVLLMLKMLFNSLNNNKRRFDPVFILYN